MKVLVYGSGVIGCYLAHVLCAAGNDVTLLARGLWKEQLQQNGLRIRHHLQRKTTLDHPRVIGGIEEEIAFDAVFAVMPYNKMPAILEPLSAVHSPIVVLVGNNMRPAAMQCEILKHSVCKKQILFGFQATAGKRDHEKGMLICERAGVGAMDIGGLHSLPDSATKAHLETMFNGSGYRLNWQPDMEAYLICHLAAVLPICYLAYACNGDLTGSTGKQRKLMRMASREAYKAGVLYTTSERNEGYLMLSGEGAGGSIGFVEGLKMIAAEKKALGGFRNMKRFISACFCDGGTIETRMRKQKRKFLRIEMLVVRKEYQGQGYMRQMMDYACRTAEQHQVPVILDTDDKDKAYRYVHLGMTLDRVRDCGERFHMYDLIRKCDARGLIE